MTYDEALDYIHGLSRFGSKLGLGRLQVFLARLGHPERHMKYVHVAGTNGKGSTTAMVASMLQAAGFKTGMYISPHLTTFNERIAVNGELVPDQRVAELVAKLAPVAEAMAAEAAAAGLVGTAGLGGDGTLAEHATEFEFITAMAFEYFRQEGVDVVALEVGMGGRFDATNIIAPQDCLAAVIPTIGWDHMERLGGTLEKIAFEKAGIIKPGRPVITGTRPAGALAVIEAVARQNGAPLWTVAEESEQAEWLDEAARSRVDEALAQTSIGGAPITGRTFGAVAEAGSGAGDEARGAGGRYGTADTGTIRWRPNGPLTADGQVFDLAMPDGTMYRDLRTRLLGRHQLDNAACAVGAIHALRGSGRAIGEEAIRTGLARATWEGRFEIMARRPWIVVDGAHNPEGAAVLRRTFETLFPGRQPVMVMGILGDKAVGPVVDTIAPMAREIVATSPNYQGRALPAEALAVELRSRGTPTSVAPSIAAAVDEGLRRLRGPDDVLLVTGSLYLVGDVRPMVLKHLAAAQPVMF